MNKNTDTQIMKKSYLNFNINNKMVHLQLSVETFYHLYIIVNAIYVIWEKGKDYVTFWKVEGYCLVDTKFEHLKKLMYLHVDVRIHMLTTSKAVIIYFNAVLLNIFSSNHYFWYVKTVSYL